MLQAVNWLETLVTKEWVRLTHFRVVFDPWLNLGYVAMSVESDAESNASRIGLINLSEKHAGERSAGSSAGIGVSKVFAKQKIANPPATFDVTLETWRW